MGVTHCLLLIQILMVQLKKTCTQIPIQSMHSNAAYHFSHTICHFMAYGQLTRCVGYRDTSTQFPPSIGRVYDQYIIVPPPPPVYRKSGYVVHEVTIDPTYSSSNHTAQSRMLQEPPYNCNCAASYTHTRQTQRRFSMSVASL